MNAFYNRLKKRHKHLKKWAKTWPTQAWRVYDRDMPEWRWSVDIYDEAVYLQEYPSSRSTPKERVHQRRAVLQAVEEVIGVPSERIFERVRKPRRVGQYDKRSELEQLSVVEEGGLKFWVNLVDYIDTGLFLDHRNLRRIAHDLLAPPAPHARPRRMLNLFCYTGAFSVWGAAAGAHTTSVDMSNTYLDWARQNFELNALPLGPHTFVRADILKWLPRAGQKEPASYDVIVLDPPSFSQSKKMSQDLEVQRDQHLLLEHALALLRPEGVLFFSTNFRGFEPDFSSLTRWEHKEISEQTVPKDFRPGIHRAWEFRAGG